MSTASWILLLTIVGNIGFIAGAYWNMKMERKRLKQKAEKIREKIIKSFRDDAKMIYLLCKDNEATKSGIMNLMEDLFNQMETELLINSATKNL